VLDDAPWDLAAIQGLLKKARRTIRRIDKAKQVIAVVFAAGAFAAAIATSDLSSIGTTANKLRGLL